MSDDDLLNARKAAQLMGELGVEVTERTIGNMRERGELTGVSERRGDRTYWHYRRGDIARAAARRQGQTIEGT